MQAAPATPTTTATAHTPLTASAGEHSTLPHRPGSLALLVQDADGRIVDAQATIPDDMIPDWITGVLIGSEAHELVHPDDRLVASTIRNDVRISGHHRLVHIRVRGGDGEWRWMGCAFAPWPDADGRQGAHTVVELSHVAGPQAALKADDDLALARQRFELAFSQAATGMALVALDGTFLDANDSLCRFLGRDREELARVGFQAITHPDDLRGDLDQVRRMLDGSLDTYQLEKRYRRPDDTFVWGLLSVSLVRDAHGAPVHFISQIQDIDARKRFELDLQRSEARFRAAFDRSPIGMALIEYGEAGTGTVVEANDQLRCLAQRLGLVWSDEWSSSFWQHGGLELGARLPAAADETTVSWESRLVGESDHRWVRVVAAPVVVAEAAARMAVLQIEDITEQRAVQDELAHRALHDGLTGLPNRMLLTQRLDHAQVRSARNGRHVGILYIDLDNFKDINDTMGHSAGDRLLCEVAERFDAVVRPSDTVARVGGDEFVVLCDDLSTDRGEAQRELLDIADRLHDALSEPLLSLGDNLYVSASVGSHVIVGGSDAASDALGNADVAMYRAKALGRSRTSVYDEALRREALERVQIAAELRHAEDRHELDVVYQPIVELKSGRLVGAEALLRWEHPVLGSVPPARFIDIAEDSNLIVDLGRFVIDRVCATLAAAPDIEYVTMNVSARQLATSTFAESIASAVERHGIDPSRLSVEITENVLIDAIDSSLRQLDALRTLGLGVGVDDFGTGFASLTYLKRLPVTFVKVDQSFVAGVNENADDRSIVQAVVGLAQALRLTPIAEGVETIEQAEFLIGLGCPLAQGYLFGRPAPAQALAEFLPSAV